MKKLNFNQKVIVYYWVIAALFILLSCISLLLNEWITIPCVGICALVGFVVTLSLLNQDVNNDDMSKVKLTVSIVIRYLVMAIGLVACAFLVKATMGEEIINKRYIIVAIAALPYFIPSIAIMLVK